MRSTSSVLFYLKRKDIRIDGTVPLWGVSPLTEANLRSSVQSHLKTRFVGYGIRTDDRPERHRIEDERDTQRHPC